jgi:hypothetical protein
MDKTLPLLVQTLHRMDEPLPLLVQTLHRMDKTLPLLVQTLHRMDETLPVLVQTLRKRHRNAHRNAVGTGRVGSQGCPTLWTTKSRF